MFTPLHQKKGATYSDRDLPASPGYKETWRFELWLRIIRLWIYSPAGAGPDVKIVKE